MMGTQCPDAKCLSMLLVWVVERYGLQRWARASAFLGLMHR